MGGYPKFIYGGFLQGVSTCADRFAVSSLHKTAAAVSKLDALLLVEIFECYMNIKISSSILSLEIVYQQLKIYMILSSKWVFTYLLTHMNFLQ